MCKIKKIDFIKKVNDTRTYLALTIKHKDEIIEKASNTTKEKVKLAYQNLNNWFSEVNTFHEKVLHSTSEKLNDLQNEWSKSMRDKWNHGLDRIIQVGKNIKIDEGRAKQMKK
uniref:Uncharacterized protein n=1 Tax=Romanomermis culicivorax TaxID=13658 RepID=A0A915JGW6_ROMCU